MSKNHHDDPPFTWDLPYASHRAPVLARNVVATSQPLAVAAGLAMFESGGNAVDAAIAAAAALTVVEPTNNGIGSDAFAIVHHEGNLYGLNASGPAPAALDTARFDGLASMPLIGWEPVTVPGAVGAWACLSERFGVLPFERLIEPAIRYAQDGYSVSPRVAAEWALLAPLYSEREDFAAAFLPGGRSPAIGATFRSPEMAETLRVIATTRGEAFYRGALAERLLEHSHSQGGAFSSADLADFRPSWVDPICVDYRGWSFWQLPPNGQGLAALIAAGILRAFDAGSDVDSAHIVHLQIEAMKLAFADTERHVADPAHLAVPVDAFLDEAYLADRARLIDPQRASSFGTGYGPRGDTVYLTTADSRGCMVSFIQSNYFGFGSGVVVPGTGISLQNRGACFSLEPGHPNRVAGGKKPRHTILPAFLERDGKPAMSFGVMGGEMQPQGLLQILSRLVDFGQNPQAAIDAPRWQVEGGLRVALEQEWPQATVRELEKRGHRIRRLSASWFGGAQAAYRIGDGYAAASEPRKDGLAAGW